VKPLGRNGSVKIIKFQNFLILKDENKIKIDPDFTFQTKEFVGLAGFISQRGALKLMGENLKAVLGMYAIMRHVQAHPSLELRTLTRFCPVCLSLSVIWSIQALLGNFWDQGIDTDPFDRFDWNKIWLMIDPLISFRQESDFERREEQWNELRRNLEGQVQTLKAELKERDEAYMAKHKGSITLRHSWLGANSLKKSRYPFYFDMSLN